MAYVQGGASEDPILERKMCRHVEINKLRKREGMLYITIGIYEVSQGTASFPFSFLSFQYEILVLFFFPKLLRASYSLFIHGLSHYGLLPFHLPKRSSKFLKRKSVIDIKRER